MASWRLNALSWRRPKEESLIFRRNSTFCRKSSWQSSATRSYSKLRSTTSNWRIRSFKRPSATRTIRLTSLLPPWRSSQAARTSSKSLTIPFRLRLKRWKKKTSWSLRKRKSRKEKKSRRRLMRQKLMLKETWIPFCKMKLGSCISKCGKKTKSSLSLSRRPKPTIVRSRVKVTWHPAHLNLHPWSKKTRHKSRQQGSRLTSC